MDHGTTKNVERTVKNRWITTIIIEYWTGYTTQTINHQLIATITMKVINAQYTEVLEEWLGFSPPTLYLSSPELWA